ncbi:MULTISPECIES: replication initiation protein [Lactobacillaceae]|uniref:replication initiation protein n=1 Tax=Lactobacillaceae TaxID=33958 RepID=UPI0021584B28|nr:replication initiation protein [Pediococcus pentosaceus]WPK17608.1 replication initiation protein [Pediococcus pentosaceus]
MLERLRLKAAWTLLLNLKDNGQSIAIIQGTPEDFKNWLGAPKSYTYGYLKRDVLNPAIKESDMDL